MRERCKLVITITLLCVCCCQDSSGFITHPPQNHVVLAGSNVTLNCATNNSETKISWQRWGDETFIPLKFLRANENYTYTNNRFVVYKHQLTIRSVEEAHTGVYWCTERFTNVHFAAFLLVLAIDDSGNLKASDNEGNRLDRQCYLSGNDVTNVSLCNSGVNSSVIDVIGNVTFPQQEPPESTLPANHSKLTCFFNVSTTAFIKKCSNSSVHCATNIPAFIDVCPILLSTDTDDATAATATTNILVTTPTVIPAVTTTAESNKFLLNVVLPCVLGLAIVIINITIIVIACHFSKKRRLHELMLLKMTLTQSDLRSQTAQSSLDISLYNEFDDLHSKSSEGFAWTKTHDAVTTISKPAMQVTEPVYSVVNKPPQLQRRPRDGPSEDSSFVEQTATDEDFAVQGASETKTFDSYNTDTLQNDYIKLD